jgi:hypothetical protein
LAAAAPLLSGISRRFAVVCDFRYRLPPPPQPPPHTHTHHREQQQKALTIQKNADKLHRSCNFLNGKFFWGGEVALLNFENAEEITQPRLSCVSRSLWLLQCRMCSLPY